MPRHRSEERGHDHGFFEDIAQMMGRPLDTSSSDPRRPYGASTVLKNDLMTCLPFTSQMMIWP